ncbi:related to Pol II transcription elongation factor [Rhynchosporium agropyri]|uniref:Related to Pol II transcription elongation factor n=2 Tax=Rhynchosporium TaxID=38037 RepID=A0A1E1L3K5_9HELO|nr:related to Pol II transcription elongation factor [Rhynchosporium commune]CZT05117.1 related to Pol II transcription elongation factor [Rhynchosporium agropyri]
MSLSDIDDELLALAGDSSDEEDNAPATATKSSSGTPDQPATGKSSTSKGKKTGRTIDDSEEEGEAQVPRCPISSGRSSPHSLRSGPMDESDSEDDSPAFQDDGERYPFEGKFVDAKDKAQILDMNEIEREQTLAERAQEVERDRQNRALRQLLKSRDLEKNQNKKRKAVDSDLQEDPRKTQRQRTKLGGGKVGEASTGIDSLKRARAEKNDRQRRREEDKDRNKDRSTARDDYSDGDADGDSEVEWDDGKSKNKKSKSPEYRDAEPASLADVQKVRIGRTRFAQVCFYPGFDEAMIGCFARISIGADKETGQNIYRMGIIKGFAEDRPYAIESATGKLFKTTQYVRAAHGKSERNWPFISCSDSGFTESEWNRFKVTCQSEGVALPTKPKLNQKMGDINSLINRSWTEAELQEKLTKSGALVQKFIPIERNRLNGMIKEARARGDTVKEEEYRKELQALDGPKLAYSTSLQPSPKKSSTSAGISQQERLAILNRQNRKKNAEEVRQAQINERRAAKQIEAAVARGEVVTEDHSRRLKTRAKFKHNVEDALILTNDKSGAQTPASSTPNVTAKKPSTAIPHLQKLQAEKKGIPSLRRPLMDDDIIGSLDLGIDIEI